MSASLPTQAPESAGVTHARRNLRMQFGRLPGRRIAASLLAIGIASAVTVMGSTASWTAQTQNTANSMTAGTMSLTNDKNAAAIFTAAGVKPGDTGASTVTLKNTGSIPIAVALTQDQVTNTFAANSALVQIHDDTANKCYWPTAASGACTTYGDWTATTATNLAIAGTSTAQWAANEQHIFTVGYKLATTSPNADQGKAAAFRLTWDAVQ